MVGRLFNFLHREFNGLHQAAFLLAVSAFGSQLLALWRDRLLAARFGAGRDLDIYYAAFRIPDLIYAALVSFVSVAVVIPFLVKRIQQDDLGGAKRFLGSLLTVFLMVAVAASVVAFIFIPLLSFWIAPGFDLHGRQQLVLLARILLLSPILLGLSNLFGSITQTLRRFFLYALAPLFYNLGIIVGVVWFYPLSGLWGLAWGVVLGALAHFLINLSAGVKSGLMPRLTFRVHWAQVKEVIAASLPRAATLGLHQFSFLVLIALASVLEPGSITVFTLSFNLQSVPLVIIGISYSVAAFPALARLFALGDREAFIEQVTTAVRHILFWSIPVTVLFIVLRAQIVRVILGVGRFDWQDTRLTAAALAVFTVSLAGQSIIHLLVRGYYACGRSRRPFLINLFSSVLIISSGWLLLKLFARFPGWRIVWENILRVEGLPGTAVLALPLAFSSGLLANTFLFWFFFQKDFGRFPKIVGRALIQSFVASLLAGAVAYLMLRVLDDFFDLNTFFGIFGQGFFAGLTGLLVFFFVLRQWGSKELAEIVKSVTSRFWHVRPIAPEIEEL